ncbi:unnamed protein product [Ceratitis capitata]|uniref:(Mediterranean fruit fly) hypothetical protein n=1 Tax=Ceratitis capitata TaxID=7213 RepID=A0A811UI64_CERCA|nr:unnamed protein product [Ceratitis capitata]
MSEMCQTRWDSKTAADGRLGYYITQMLSGHGYFLKHLRKIGKVLSLSRDGAEHTFLKCHDGKLEDACSQVIKAGKSVKESIECLLRAKKWDLDAGGAM